MKREIKQLVSELQKRITNLELELKQFNYCGDISDDIISESLYTEIECTRRFRNKLSDILENSSNEVNNDDNN